LGCFFYPQHPERTDLQFPASPDLGGFLHDFFEGGWYRTDPRAMRGWPLAESGRPVILEHDIASDDERRQSPYYQTFIPRHDMPNWAAIIFAVHGRRWCMPILRSAAQGQFTPSDAQDFAALSLQLRNVVSLAGRFAVARAKGAIEALEQAGCAALVLDHCGRSLALNGLAEKTLCDDIALIRGRLHARDRESEQRLQKLIDRAVGPRTAGAGVPAPVFVTRREKRPYMVEGMPATGALRDMFGHVAALLLITDLDARPRPAEGLIRDAFGLTAAEARLAAALAAGDDLWSAAERLKITHETSRGHLKAIFSKADVNRQSELAALIARLRTSRGG